MSKSYQSLIPRTMMTDLEKMSYTTNINPDFTPIVSVEEGIRAGIKDPLWFLGRQWQMGEFEGSNNGHVIKTVIDYEIEPLAQIEKYEANIPTSQISNRINQTLLEPFIEGGKEQNCNPDIVGGFQKAPEFWNREQLEYHFQCLGEKGSRLPAKEYFGEHLDWYSFTGASVKKTGTITEKFINMIPPSRVRFPGMPHARWWQFEDARVDLGNIRRINLNFLSVLLTQFALSYSNDWYTIPLPQPINTLRKIKNIKVTDTFGTEFIILPHKNNDDFGFSLFTLDLKGSTQNNISPEQSSKVLLLPNTIVHSRESDPYEEVIFFRDEIANLVWAVERKAFDEGKVINRMDEQSIQKEAVKSTLPVYQLQSPMPENWIPYVPQKLQGSTSQIRFRRGKTWTPPAITGLPREYRQYKGQIIDESKHIKEEEIPSTPIVITQNFCLAVHGEEKWKFTNLTQTSGKLALDSQKQNTIWIGRKKKRGQRMEMSQLRFDYLVE